MKFPRNARIFRGQLDAAPFAAVFFLLVIFVMLGSLIYTPGVPLQLPVANDLPGTDKPTVSVAIDGNGRLYYENQSIEETQLRGRLRQAVKNSPDIALLVLADKAVSYDMLMRLTMLARDAGISQAWLATLPRPSAVIQ
ncbi:MAG TPA: biopolymer transporter ExbD [Candidatus Limnocylindrales bacterium]|jgi:biopolymer transport protein ExbD|nr:biopolymer transporter ExbD [Candidatus Limnocylindrales bacterium]